MFFIHLGSRCDDGILFASNFHLANGDSLTCGIQRPGHHPVYFACGDTMWLDEAEFNVQERQPRHPSLPPVTAECGH